MSTAYLESSPSAHCNWCLNVFLTGMLAVLFALLVLPAAHAQITATFDNASVLSTGSLLNQPQGVAVDAKGDVYITNYGNNNVVEVTAAGVASVFSTGSLTLRAPDGVAVDGAGNLYIADYNNNRIVEVTPPQSQTMGQATVGSSGTPVTMSYTIGGYSGSSYTPIFQMNYGKEVIVGTVTCTGGAAPETCSAPVTLKPAFPGPRTDALKVLDPTSGNALLTETLVYGTGNGPLGVFSPGSVSVLNTGSLTLQPQATAIDGAGNLYIADTGNSRIVEVTAAGIASVLNTGNLVLGSPQGVAVDSAGNVYIASTGYNQIIKVSAAGVATVLSTGSLNVDPQGIAVDTAGDVYVTDAANRVVEITAAGAVTVLNTGSFNVSFAYGLTVDGNGNVYIANQGSNNIVKVTAAGVATVLSTGSITLNPDFGVAVDSAGNIYITDGGIGIVQLTPSGNASFVNTGSLTITTAYGVTVDGAGNLYIADYGNNRVVKVVQAQAAPLSFASTKVGSTSSDSPQNVMVENIGNQTLNMTALTAATTGQTTSSFNLNGSGTTCTDTTTLAPGTTCGLGVEFQPLVAGTLTGTVNLTDNSLNAVAPNNVQQINLSGTGIALPTPTVTVTPSASSVTTAQALTVTVAVSGGTGNPAPTGTVTLTGGGYTFAATPLTSGTATISIAAGALTAGTDILTVNYSGDQSYSAATGSATITVTALIGSAVATVTVTPAAPSITDQQRDAVKVSVAGGSGQPTPTGTVTLTSGTYTAQQALASGSASFTIPAGALSSGADTLTAAYSGDTTYGTANGTASITVAQVAIAVPAPPSVSPGASTTASATISAGSTYSGTMNLTCALASSPTGAQSQPTCSLNPASVTLTAGGNGTSILTVKTTAASTSALAQPFEHNLWKLGGGRTVLAALLLFGIPSRRRRWMSMMVVLWIIAAVGLSACGGGGSGTSGGGSTTPATTAGNYTFTVTGTDATNSKITTSTNVTVTVQ